MLLNEACPRDPRLVLKDRVTDGAGNYPAAARNSRDWCKQSYGAIMDINEVWLDLIMQ